MWHHEPHAALQSRTATRSRLVVVVRVISVGSRTDVHRASEAQVSSSDRTAHMCGHLVIDTDHVLPPQVTFTVPLSAARSNEYTDSDPRKEQ
jgi:hypothetical protein